MIKTIDLSQAPDGVREMVSRLSEGEQINFVQSGEEVAVLRRAPRRHSAEEIARAIEGFKAHTKKVGATATVDEILEWKREGRR